eukprot:Clim_evm174s157 gene=Clim_evmTU174s157
MADFFQELPFACIDLTNWSLECVDLKDYHVLVLRSDQVTPYLIKHSHLIGIVHFETNLDDKISTLLPVGVLQYRIGSLTTSIPAPDTHDENTVDPEQISSPLFGLRGCILNPCVQGASTFFETSNFLFRTRSRDRKVVKSVDVALSSKAGAVILDIGLRKVNQRMQNMKILSSFEKDLDRIETAIHAYQDLYCILDFREADFANEEEETEVLQAKVVRAFTSHVDVKINQRLQVKGHQSNYDLRPRTHVHFASTDSQMDMLLQTLSNMATGSDPAMVEPSAWIMERESAHERFLIQAGLNPLVAQMILNHCRLYDLLSSDDICNTMKGLCGYIHPSVTNYLTLIQTYTATPTQAITGQTCEPHNAPLTPLSNGVQVQMQLQDGGPRKRARLAVTQGETPSTRPLDKPRHQFQSRLTFDRRTPDESGQTKLKFV